MEHRDECAKIFRLLIAGEDDVARRLECEFHGAEHLRQRVRGAAPLSAKRLDRAEAARASSLVVEQRAEAQQVHRGDAARCGLGPVVVFLQP